MSAQEEREHEIEVEIADLCERYAHAHYSGDYGGLLDALAGIEQQIRALKQVRCGDNFTGGSAGGAHVRHGSGSNDHIRPPFAEGSVPHDSSCCGSTEGSP